MLLECNSRNADECVATLAEIIDERGGVQIECSEVEGDVCIVFRAKLNVLYS